MYTKEYIEIMQAFMAGVTILSKNLELYSRIGQKLNEEEEEFLKEMWNKRVEEMREETKRELRKLKK